MPAVHLFLLSYIIESVYFIFYPFLVNENFSFSSSAKIDHPHPIAETENSTEMIWQNFQIIILNAGRGTRRQTCSYITGESEL